VVELLRHRPGHQRLNAVNRVLCDARQHVVQLGDVDFPLVPGEDRSVFPTQIDGVPVYTTEGTLQPVLVCHAEHGFSFRVAPQATWMNVWCMLHVFDRFMALMQRPERAHRLAQGSWVSNRPCSFAPSRRACCRCCSSCGCP
jgi:hypothetical protein